MYRRMCVNSLKSRVNVFPFVNIIVKTSEETYTVQKNIKKRQWKCDRSVFARWSTITHSCNTYHRRVEIKRSKRLRRRWKQRRQNNGNDKNFTCRYGDNRDLILFFCFSNRDGTIGRWAHATAVLIGPRENVYAHTCGRRDPGEVFRPSKRPLHSDR